MSTATVYVVTTGGTIASRPDRPGGGAVAAISADELVAQVPALRDIADVDVVDFALVNSWDVTPALVVELTRAISGLDLGGNDGVVITHGTDTMEETAFALDLLLDIPQPVVLTGAMRNPTQPGADGPANLVAAATVAVAEEARGLGVVVVMNDEVHAARSVHKSHTTAPSTFTSPGAGALGSVDPSGLQLRSRPLRLPPLDAADAGEGNAVWLVPTGEGLDDGLLRAALQARVGGLVLEGSGSGNVPSAWQGAIRALVDADIPVVLTSRCEGGRVVPVYGGAGGGRTLVDMGVIPGGGLAAPKARLALIFALGAGYDLERIRTWFAGAG